MASLKLGIHIRDIRPQSNHSTGDPFLDITAHGHTGVAQDDVMYIKEQDETARIEREALDEAIRVEEAREAREGPNRQFAANKAMVETMVAQREVGH